MLPLEDEDEPPLDVEVPPLVDEPPEELVFSSPPPVQAAAAALTAKTTAARVRADPTGSGFPPETDEAAAAPQNGQIASAILKCRAHAEQG